MSLLAYFDSVKEIDFKGSTSTLNLLSKNSNTNIKFQNISSNISKSLASRKSPK